MKSHRRPWAVVAAASALAAALLGLTPGNAAGAVPAAFTLRYSAQGWADVAQVGAATLACPANARTCQDGSDLTIPTAWIDVDTDASTVNSSRATLTIPPQATVDWVGLYWAADRGTRDAGAPPRCEAAPESAAPATPPPAPDKANQIRLAIDDGAYKVITSGSLNNVTGPGGGSGFQGYADITALIRPPAGTATPAQVRLAVADLQAAQGPGCGGGWTAVLAYSYGDGPNKAHAPTYGSIAIFDGAVPVTTGIAQAVKLDGLAIPATGDVQARLSMSLFASGQALGQEGLTLDDAAGARVPRFGDGVTGIVGLPGLAYQQANSRLPSNAIKAGATATTLALTPVRSGFVTAVLALSTPLNAKVDLSVTTVVAPTSAAVGEEAALTITVRNDAGLTASGVVVTAKLPRGLKLIAETPGYDASTGQWAVGKVGAHGSVALSLRVLIEEAGGLVSTAEVTASDIPDVDSTPGDGVATQDDRASVTVTALPATAPTATNAPAQATVIETDTWQWPESAPAALFGIGLFLLGLLLLSIVLVRHRAAR